MSVAIVGRGRVGRGLTRALSRAGEEARLTSGRAPRPRALRGASAVVVATPDPFIAATAAKVRALAPRAPLLHCSGSLGPEACGVDGPHGVMHPLASFADPARPPALAGVAFVIAGDRVAAREASRIARALGARPLVRAVHGAGYHAAAALSANGAAALATIAVRVLEAKGLARREAERAVGALLRTVGENVERVGVPRALSGPVMRGNADVVARHQAALALLDPSAREAYDAIAPAILDCARRAGLDEARADAIEALLVADGEPAQGTSST